MKRISTAVLIVAAFAAEVIAAGARRMFGNVPSLQLHALPPDYPGLRDFWQKVKGDFQGGQATCNWWPLYDTMIYPTAGQTNLAFFAATLGAGGNSAQPGNAGGNKTLADTNMVGQAGMLPKDQAFFVHSIEINVEPGSVATANTFTLQIPALSLAAQASTAQAGAHDVNAIYSTGACQLSIGQNNPVYQDAPLRAFPPRSSWELQTSVGSDSDAAAVFIKEKLKIVGPLNQFAPGYSIPGQTVFGVNLFWPVAVATPSGFNAQVQVKLNGWLFKGLPQ